jgi:hypothetical protein
MRIAYSCAIALFAIIATPAGSAGAANWTLRQLPLRLS